MAIEAYIEDRIKSEDDLIRYIEDKLDKISNYNLLLGAGASYTSGIDTAQALEDKWRKELYYANGANKGKEYTIDNAKKFLSEKYRNAYNPDKEYSFLFEKKYDRPTQRRNFVETQVANAKMSIGYHYLANLVENKFINTIFTTNFDDLTESALLKIESDIKNYIKPIVCSHDSTISNIYVVSTRPKVIKLHGDFLYDDIKATYSETSRLEKNMEDKLKEFLKNFGLIVVGYSGRDDSIMDIIEKLIKMDGYLDSGLYWCVRDIEDVCQNERLKRLLLLNKKTYIVKINGFDNFFAKLNHKLVKCKCKDENDKSYLPYKISEKTFSELFDESIKTSLEKFNDDEIIVEDCRKSNEERIKKLSESTKKIRKQYKEEELTKDEKNAYKYDINDLDDDFDEINFTMPNDILEAKIESLNESIRRKDLNEIISKSDEILKNIDEEEYIYLVNSINYLKVKSLMLKDCENEAIEVIKNLITTNEKHNILNVKNYLNLAKIIEDKNEALTYAEKALEENPYSYHGYVEKASILEDIINNDIVSTSYVEGDIIENYKKSIEINPSVRNNPAYVKLSNYILNESKNFTTFGGDDKYTEIIENPFLAQNPFDPDYPGILISKAIYDIFKAEKNKEEIYAPIKAFYDKNIDIKDRKSFKLYLCAEFMKISGKLNKIDELKKIFKKNDDIYKKSYNYCAIKSDTYFTAFRNIQKGKEILEQSLQYDKKEFLLYKLIWLKICANDMENIEEQINRLKDKDKRNYCYRTLYAARKQYEELYKFSKNLFDSSNKTVKDHIRYSYDLLICKKDKEVYDLLNNISSKDSVLIINYNLARKRLGKKIKNDRVIPLQKSNDKTTKAASYILDNKKAEAKKILKEMIENDYSDFYSLREFPIFEDIDFSELELPIIDDTDADDTEAKIVISNTKEV